MEINRYTLPFLFLGDYMATPTKQQLLDKVNEAIDVRLTGGAVASYSIGGRNLQYISLRELMDLRDKLQREVNAESSTGTTNYIGFDR